MYSLSVKNSRIAPGLPCDQVGEVEEQPGLRVVAEPVREGAGELGSTQGEGGSRAAGHAEAGAQQSREHRPAAAEDHH